MAKEIIILHEYGDKRHYEALEYCSEYNVVYYEFSIFRQLLKFYKTRDFKYIYKLFVNLYFLSRINKIKDKIIVLGMAPYDWHILLFSKLLENNKIIYHTSWTFWERSNQPKIHHKYHKNIKIMWKLFLENPHTKIITVTAQAKVSLLMCFECKYVNVIPHSISDEFQSIKSRLGFNEKIKILFVGRLIPEKGIDLILDASKKLGSEYEFHFVGEGKFKKILKKVSIKDSRIIIHGKINDKKKLNSLYNSCDFLILPSISNNSWEEVFGIVIIEGMSTGIVVIASESIGSTSIIINGKNGIIIPQNSSIDIYRSIVKLSINKKQYRYISNNALNSSKDYHISKIEQHWHKAINLLN